MRVLHSSQVYSRNFLQTSAVPQETASGYVGAGRGVTASTVLALVAEMLRYCLWCHDRCCVGNDVVTCLHVSVGTVVMMVSSMMLSGLVV